MIRSKTFDRVLMLLSAMVLTVGICGTLSFASEGGGPTCNGLAEPAQPTVANRDQCAQLPSGYSCTPANPEPTTWHRICCYEAPAGICWQVWHRWQCCVPPTEWQHYYKKKPFTNACEDYFSPCSSLSGPPEEGGDG
jgi:hypothetical protein